MTFPTIPTGGRVVVANQLNTTATRTISLTGLTKSAGDLLIAAFVGYQSSTTNAQWSGWTSGWTEFHDTGTSTTAAIGLAYKWSDGTESTLSATQAATITGDASMIVMSIPGAHLTTPPEAGGRADATTASDPTAFNPSGWDVEDTLWVAVHVNGMTNASGAWAGTGATAPTNYSSLVRTAASDTSTIGDVELAVAFRQNAVASEDAGTFSGTDTSNARNSTLLIAVRPAPNPAITQAAYRFYADGTESGSTALAAQDTAPTVNVNTNPNLQLRVRLQETAGGSPPATDDWQLQYELNASGTWIAATSEVLLTDYPVANANATWPLGASNLGTTANAMSFMSGPTAGWALSKVGFRLLKTGSPTGLLSGQIWAHSGTFGAAGSMPTGGSLYGSSDTINIASLTGSAAWYYVNFSPPLGVAENTPYFVGLATNQTASDSNFVQMSVDNSSPTYAGSGARRKLSDSTWQAEAEDAIFEVYMITGLAGTSAVIEFNSTNLDNTAPSTNRLTGGTGTFVAGDVAEDGVCNDFGWTANNFTEMVYGFQLVAANLSHGDTIRFRLLRNGATTSMTYSATPTINVTAAINEKNRPVAITATTTLTEAVKYRDLATDAYLAPRAAVAKTPDPATMPTTGFVFVMKVRGPVVATGNDQSIVSQNETDGNTSYRVNRDPDNHTAWHAGYPSGTFASGVFLTSNGAWGGRDDNDCLLAWSYVISSGAWTLKKSTDNGVTYPNTSTGTGPTSGLFNSTGPVCIGADSGGASSKFDGRIYWVELRSGVDPLGGTLLWRFDARDWVSGTGWTDPRGNVWTLEAAGAVVAQAMTHLAVATVTSTDTLTAPVNYNETNRPVVIVSAVTLPVDQADFKEIGGGVAGPPAFYTDNFNRADGAAPGWVGAGGSEFTIVSNQLARNAGATGSDFFRYDTDLGSPDMFVEASIPATGSYRVLDARGSGAMSSPTTYMGYWNLGSNCWQFAKTVAGSFSALAASAATTEPAVPYTLRFEVVGSDLRLYANGNLVHSQTDTSITTGNYAGVNANTHSASVYDNFRCGALASTVVLTDTWTGANGAVWDGANWPKQNLPANFTIDTNRGKSFRADGARHFTATDLQLTNFELLVKLEYTADYPEIGYRVTGNYSVNLDGYVFQMQGGSWILFDLGYTSIASATAPTSPGTYWIKIRCVGSSHKIRWWADGSGEPGTWNIDTTHTGATRGGAFMLGDYGTHTLYWDSLTITNLGVPLNVGSVEMVGGSMQTENPMGLAVADQTWTGWVRFNRAISEVGDQPFLTLDSGSEWLQLNAEDSDGTIRLFSNTGDLGGPVLKIGHWYFLAVTRSTTNSRTRLYAAKDGDALSLVNSAASALGTISNSTYMKLGRNGYGHNGHINVAGVRVWTAELTQTELETERASLYTAVRTANLHAAWSFSTGTKMAPVNGYGYVTDESGNSRTMVWDGNSALDGDSPLAPVGSAGGVGLLTSVVSTITTTDAVVVHYNETNRSVAIVSTYTQPVDKAGRKELTLATAIVSATATTDRARFIEAGPNASFPAPYLAYNFSESGTTALDVTGNGRTSALVRTATPRDLHAGNELFFASGTEDALVYTPAVKPTNAASVTLKLRTGASQPIGSMWVLMNANDTSGFNLGVREGDFRIQVIVRATGVAIFDPVGSALLANTTYQLALVYDGVAGQTKVYLNGAQIGTTSTAATGNLNISGSEFRTGYNTWNPSTYPISDFFVDDIRFWHVALTDAQVAVVALTPVNPTAADLSVAIVSTISSTDTYTSGSVRYDETGRAVVIVSAVATTDLIKRGETGRAVAIISTVSLAVDQTDYDMLALPVVIASTVTTTDLIKRGETDRPVAVISTVTTTDVAHRRDTPLGLTLVSGVTVTDLLTQPGHYDETNRPVSILATMTLPVDQADLHDTPVSVAAVATVSNAVDQTDYDQLNLPVTIVSAVSITEAVKRSELARPVAIVATVTNAVDQTDYHETALSVAVASTVGITTAVKLGELTRPVAIVATIATPTDRAGRKEPNLTVATVATNSLAVDQADFKDLARGVAITATITSLDVMSGAPINYTETNLKVIVVSTLTWTDRAFFRSPQALTVVSATTSTDLLHLYETQRAVAITSTLTTTDRAYFKDLPVSVAIVSATTFVNVAHRSDLDRPVAISSTVTATSRGDFNDMFDIGVVSLFSALDRADFHDVLRTLVLISTFGVFDLQYYAGGTVLNRADAVFLGEQVVEAVYVGATKVWP